MKAGLALSHSTRSTMRTDSFSMVGRSTKSSRSLRRETKRTEWIDDSNIDYQNDNTRDLEKIKEQVVARKGDSRKKLKNRENSRRKITRGTSRTRRSRQVGENHADTSKNRPRCAGENFPDIVSAMRRASNETRQALREGAFARFKGTEAYARVAITSEAFWFEAVPKRALDWSSFLGLPMSGYNHFYKFASGVDCGTYLSFLTAARELESFESQSGDYAYLLKFYEIFTTYVDVNINFEKLSSHSSSSLSAAMIQEDEHVIAAGLSELRTDMGEQVVKQLEAVHARYFKSSLDRFLDSDDDQEDLLIFEASPVRDKYQLDDSTY